MSLHSGCPCPPGCRMVVVQQGRIAATVGHNLSGAFPPFELREFVSRASGYSLLLTTNLLHFKQPLLYLIVPIFAALLCDKILPLY